MSLFKQDFTTRQYMVTPDYEFFHYKDKTTTEVEYHNHDFYEIYFFISGKVTYVIEGKSYKLEPGDILLITNNQLHKPIIAPTDFYQRIVLWVNPAFLEKHSDAKTNLSMCFEAWADKKYNLLRPYPEVRTHMMHIVSKFESACNSISFGNNILKEIYLLELLIYLNKSFIETFEKNIEIDITHNEKIDNIIEYINQNLDKELTLDLLSSIFYLSKYHLLREFKKYTGYTIHKYIQQKRLMLAKSLLKKGLQVTQVCEKCGYQDYANFIRSFKKSFGIPPKKYGKNLIE